MASIITAVFVLALISTILGAIRGQFSLLRASIVITILFHWDCYVLAIIAIIMSVIWGVIMTIVHLNE